MEESNSIPRIIPPVYGLLSIIAMIGLNKFAPIGSWLHSPWRYFGIVLIILGFVFVFGNAMLFRRMGTNPRPGVKATALVTTGAFRRTRNPMYVGMVVILIGVATLLGSFSPLFLIPMFIWIIQTQFIRREEKWMEDWFGESYLEYKRKTPRWL